MKSKKNRAIALIDRHSSGDSVRKHVAAIHTSGELSLVERKMANVFLLNAYDDLLSGKTHTIPVKILSAMLGWDESNNIERLQAALRKLTSTSIEFDLMEDGKGSWAVVSMLSLGEIKNGICSYRYEQYLAEKLYDPDIYATINIGIQRQLKGGYSLALYENCLRYKNVGSTGWWEMEKLRQLVGADNEYYDDFRRLNSKVIKPSVEEINKSSDIFIEPEFKKESRKITSVRFLVRENSQQALFKQEETDEFVALRESDIYKRLKEHGIGDKLAISWILQDEERARAVVDYVEAKDKKQLVKGSTAGYIRKLIEDKAEVGKPSYEAKKEEEAKAKADEAKQKELEKKRAELEAECIRERTTEAVNKLSVDDKKRLIPEYLAETGQDKGKGYNEETGTFRDSLERILFMNWLRKRFAVTVSQEEVRAWYQERMGKGLR